MAEGASTGAAGEYALAEQRLSLLHALQESLERAQAAVVKSDLLGLAQETEQQGELCRQLSRVPHPEECGGRGLANRWRELLEQTAQAERQLIELNRVYGALLRRARRTVDIFCRLLSESVVTYAPPRAAAKVGPRR